MLISKRDIRLLIGRGELNEAVESALAYAEYCTAVEPANKLTVLSSRLQAHKDEWNSGRISYEEFSRAHARIAYDLTSLLEELPDSPAPLAGKRTLLDEAKFKKRLFYFLCASNLIVIFRVYYHSPFWMSSFQSKAETFAIIGLLVPIFAAYLPVMLSDYLRNNQSQTISPRRFVSGPLVTISYWLFPLYTFALLYAIEMYADQSDLGLTFTELSTTISLIETVLGAYVGQIVFAFFKKD